MTKNLHPQILTANIAEIMNGIGRDGFEQIESSDIQELLESQNEDLTETDLEEMLNSQPIEEEASTSTGKSELKELLKTAKQEKITKFFKPLPKP
ncbi:hypothetical protein EVAR_82637_1 [Eumeta japonica]|uniref:Uncharacterized protein n=1 Tax=Eumeta variegata TaxID=151549 RepID=A0A4C1VAK6_EUMVA|nr:hypothetical protein EVAR_82637_1 [Eumeta japonica]